MKILRYAPIKDESGKWVDSTMFYGRGTANLLTYMLEPFREGWDTIGMIKCAPGMEWYGMELEEYSLVSLFGNRHSIRIHSDSIPQEQKQIDEGKTAIILFYGTDNSSVMRRMTPEEYDKMELEWFDHVPGDLFYNS